MNEEQKQRSIEYCMKLLYPEYFETDDKEKKHQLMMEFLDDIYQIGLEELLSRVLFMYEHMEEKK